MNRRTLLASLVPLAGMPAAWARAARASRLVVVGGAEDRLQDRLILRRFADYSGGPQARIRLITAASSEPEAVAGSYRRVFEALGVQDFADLPLRDRDSAAHAAVVQGIEEADGIFISGGDQARLMEVLWETPAYAALHQAFHVRGCCIGGTSAGAAVMSRHMIAQGPAVLRPSKEVTSTDMGLGLLSAAVVDQHFSERRRLARLLSTLALRPDLLGVGIDEDTALVVERGVAVEVIGQGAVTLVDTTEMQSNVDDVDSQAHIEMLGVVLHTLPAGRRYRVGEQPRRWPQQLDRALRRLIEPGPVRG
jgi:cyanophycinase